MNKLINKFNHQDTRLVISDYPEKTIAGEKNYGIAWYTKSLIEPLAKEYGVKFVVLAEKNNHLEGGRMDSFEVSSNDDRILVLRIFDQKHPTLFPRILKWLFIFNRVKYLDIHSEFCTNGGIKNFMLLLPFMILIKLTGKHITYFSHNVVTDLNAIATHLGLTKNSVKLKIYSLGLRCFYLLLGLIVNRFVVMDEVIYKRLSLFVNPNKIYLNPFWIDPSPVISRTSSSVISRRSREIPRGSLASARDDKIKSARRKLGIKKNEFVLLYFGFITYYKGADWLVKTVKKLINTNFKFPMPNQERGDASQALTSCQFSVVSSQIQVNQLSVDRLLTDRKPTNQNPTTENRKPITDIQDSELNKQTSFRNIRLILAGGRAYSLKDKKYYQKFYQKIKKAVKSKPNIHLTGFVPEQDIATYFQACDLVVFPYRGIIGGSGSLSHAISFHKPFVISNKMKELLENQDLKNALIQNKVNPQDITFDHSLSSFASIIEHAKHPQFKAKLTKVSEYLAETRSRDHLLTATYANLYAPPKSIPSMRLKLAKTLVGKY